MKYIFTNPYFDNAEMKIKDLNIIIKLKNKENIISDDCENLYNLIKSVIKYYNLYCKVDHVAERSINSTKGNTILLTNMYNNETKQIIYYDFPKITKTDLDGVFLDLQALMNMEYPNFIEKFNNR